MSDYLSLLEEDVRRFSKSAKRSYEYLIDLEFDLRLMNEHNFQVTVAVDFADVYNYALPFSSFRHLTDSLMKGSSGPRTQRSTKSLYDDSEFDQYVSTFGLLSHPYANVTILPPHTIELTHFLVSLVAAFQKAEMFSEDDLTQGLEYLKIQLQRNQAFGEAVQAIKADTAQEAHYEVVFEALEEFAPVIVGMASAYYKSVNERILHLLESTGTKLKLPQGPLKLRIDEAYKFAKLTIEPYLIRCINRVRSDRVRQNIQDARAISIIIALNALEKEDALYLFSSPARSIRELDEIIRDDCRNGRAPRDVIDGFMPDVIQPHRITRQMRSILRSTRAYYHLVEQRGDSLNATYQQTALALKNHTDLLLLPGIAEKVGFDKLESKDDITFIHNCDALRMQVGNLIQYLSQYGRLEIIINKLPSSELNVEAFAAARSDFEKLIAYLLDIVLHNPPEEFKKHYQHFQARRLKASQQDTFDAGIVVLRLASDGLESLIRHVTEQSSLLRLALSSNSRLQECTLYFDKLLYRRSVDSNAFKMQYEFLLSTLERSESSPSDPERALIHSFAFGLLGMYEAASIVAKRALQGSMRDILTRRELRELELHWIYLLIRRRHWSMAQRRAERALAVAKELGLRDPRIPHRLLIAMLEGYESKGQMVLVGDRQQALLELANTARDWFLESSAIHLPNDLGKAYWCVLENNLAFLHTAIGTPNSLDEALRHINLMKTVLSPDSWLPAFHDTVANYYSKIYELNGDKAALRQALVEEQTARDIIVTHQVGMDDLPYYENRLQKLNEQLFS